MSTYEQTHMDLAMSVIRELNSSGLQGGTHYYDCGEYGLLVLTWNGRWVVRWEVLNRKYNTEKIK